MTYKIIDDQFDRTTFNQHAYHPLQSFEWGEVRKNTGVSILRIGEFDQNTLINVFTMTVHSIPHTSFKIGYIPRSVLPSEKLLTFLTTYGKTNRFLFLKFEPYEIASDNSRRLIQNLRHTISNFQESAHPLFPKWTQTLDLSADEDTLLKNMKSKTRYNMRYAIRKGIMVREESNDKGFNVFSDLYFTTTKRQKYRGHDQSYHQAIWDGLKNKYAHILVAYYNSMPLAAYELFLFKDRFYYPYGGSSPEHRELMASNLLMWEAIKLGKNLKAQTFDMWGSLPPSYDRNGKWSGFTRFKEGYGTEFVEFVGSYDLVINPVLYPLFSMMYYFRSKLFL
ncbi:MAG: FemAB family protein [Candidatus Roizmanbacteria bacterium GW2011_GWA2_37_7]|uniref:FemAB family protein n=1 Tax=Candidatus Roizmanbacteria bacterium GW2011_GWA2_37_7 TaxID=1618481 RepID=A0A0G0H4U4_9BACT|nr:MAG: FemAB family protein [Candidatus Roizmanbacteria bacterium GW2011_GWA2_37_7]